MISHDIPQYPTISHDLPWSQASTGEVFMGVYASGELQSKTKIDKASLQTGTDEWGKRIKFHTASLTGEQAICAGLGNFMYTGGETLSSIRLLRLLSGRMHRLSPRALPSGSPLGLSPRAPDASALPSSSRLASPRLSSPLLAC